MPPKLYRASGQPQKLGQSHQIVAWQNGQGVAVPIAQVYDRSPLLVNPEGD